MTSQFKISGGVRRARSTRRRLGFFDEKERGNKMTVAQGGTPTHNLANSLPCSSQLGYQVTRQLSG